jgi:hypothetical protein
MVASLSTQRQPVVAPLWFFGHVEDTYGGGGPCRSSRRSWFGMSGNESLRR